MGFKRKALVCLLALTLLCAGTYPWVSAEEEAAVATDADASEEPVLTDDSDVSEVADALSDGLENSGDVSAVSDAPAAAGAETEASSNDEIYNEAQTVSENISAILQTLGLMDETEVYSSGAVTRGYAAGVLLRIDNTYGGGTATGNIYSDVSSDTLYAYEIEAATLCGYFFGTGGNEFRPDDGITPAQMATVLLRLAGYPEQNIRSSSEYGKLVKSGRKHDSLTYPELADMLYSFLDINTLELVSLAGDREKSSDTVLNSFFDIYKFKGTVTENDITGLWSGSDLKKNCVVVAGNDESYIFDKGETDLDSMIGRRVEVYYTDDDSKSESVCVCYDALDSQNTVTEVDLYSVDFDASTDSRLEYFVGAEKKKRIKYGAKTAIIYNGTYYDDTAAILDKVNGKEGTIAVIDNNNDEFADIFYVEAYDTFTVSSVALSSNTVFFKNTNLSMSLDREEYDRFILKDADGNDFFIEDFVDGTVLSVAENSTGAKKKVIKVLVSEEKINGTVTNVYVNDFGRNVIKLDNMDEYELLTASALPNLGQGVILALNAFGRVAYIDYSNSGEFAYGIITQVLRDLRAGSVRIKMITAQNTIETFSVTTKLNVDKTSYKNMDALYSKLERTDNISVGNQKLPAGVYPVRYKLRADGSLSELDTDFCDALAGENDNTLEFLDSGYRILQRELVMGGTFALRSSTPVFRISGSTTEGIIDKEYFEDTKYTRMSNVNDLLSANSKYNYAAYKVDEDSLYADFLIVSSMWGQGYDDKLFVIENITTAYDERTGTAVRCVDGMESGIEKQMLVSDFYTKEFDEIGLACGDVIRYDTDGYGQIISVEDLGSCSWVVKHKLSDASAKTIDINNISSGRTNLSDFKNEAYSTQMIFGYVKERRGNYITLSVITPGTHNLDGKRSSADMGKETVLIKIPDSAAITVFDPTKTDKVYAATYDEILDYKHNGSNCSLVALHFRTGRLLDAVVLNDYSLYR